MIQSHEELEVYKLAFDAAMSLFEVSKSFPPEERYALIDQIRRSSRLVCGNMAEAWRKRRYEAAFISKLNDAEAEAAETQTWISFAIRCDISTKKRDVSCEKFIIGNSLESSTPDRISPKGMEVGTCKAVTDTLERS